MNDSRKDSRNDSTHTRQPLGWCDDTWYAIADATKLKRGPLAVTRFGERLVLFRDGDGVVRCVDARCPHRGADLGRGRVVAGTLQCPYHGFRYDGSGHCVAMPCEGPSVRIPSRLRTRAHPVLERNGFVWLFRGDAAPTSEPPWFDAVPTSTRRSAGGEMIWKASFARAIEGTMDMHHVPFAHRRAGLGLFGARLDPYKAHLEGEVIRTAGVLRSEDRKGRALNLTIDVHFPGLVYLGLTPSMPGIAVAAPIDAHSTWIGFRYYVDRPLGSLLAWLAVATELKLVQPDDRWIAETATPDEPGLDSICAVRADAGIVHWHRLAAAARDAAAAPTLAPVELEAPTGSSAS